MLNLHHLRLFRAVAIDGTLTGAANRLNLFAIGPVHTDQGARGRLGHDLFERRGRGLVMTEADELPGAC